MSIFFIQNKRFLFVARIKFAKYYSEYFFNLKYQQLKRCEKFYLTYFIFCKDIKKSYIDFQNESNYQIFKKVSLDEFNILENEQKEIDLNVKQKYEKLIKDYIKTDYYQKKEQRRKEYDLKQNKTIDTPMGTYSIKYGFLNSEELYENWLNFENEKQKIIKKN